MDGSLPLAGANRGQRLTAPEPFAGIQCPSTAHSSSQQGHLSGPAHHAGKPLPFPPVLGQIHWLQQCSYCQEMGCIQCSSCALGWLGGGTYLAQQVPKLSLALQVPQPWGVWAGHVHNKVVSQRAQCPDPGHIVSCSISRALVLAQVDSKRHPSCNPDTGEPGQQDQPPPNGQSTQGGAPKRRSQDQLKLR